LALQQRLQSQVRALEVPQAVAVPGETLKAKAVAVADKAKEVAEEMRPAALPAEEAANRFLD
jgi:hypothetical protein